MPQEIFDFFRPFRALKEGAGIEDWEKLLQSDLSKEQIGMFMFMRTSEAIRAKIKDSIDHPPKK